MKSVVAALGALVAVAVAQYPSGFPDCGATCVNNMLAKYQDFGCSSGDVECLCKHANFNYGIHDCAYEHCQDTQKAQTAIEYGVSLCLRAGVTLTTTVPQTEATSHSGITETSGAATTESASAVGAGAIWTSYAVYTSVNGNVTSVVTLSTSYILPTQGAQVPTSTGETAVTTVVNGSAIETSVTTTFYSTISSVATNGSLASTLASQSSESSANSNSASSRTLTSASSEATSSTSTAFAPMKTAAPGLLAAAGIAAFLL